VPVPAVRRARRRILPADRGRSERIWRATAVLGGVIVAGTVGYILLGLSPLDALYQTAITITTVGYREVGSAGAPSAAYRVFTAVFAVVGVASAFFVFGLAVEALFEGRLEIILGRRRMTRDIAQMRDHIVVCGAGRVGRELVEEVRSVGRDVVVIDIAAAQLERLPGINVIEGDATDDDVLRMSGLERAKVLVAALSDDTQNVYVVLSARAMTTGLFIVARAHAVDAEPKLVRAGADRVVNPQFIGGRRMATYALQPHVAEFLDVVMHSGDVEWRLEELHVAEGSALDGRSLGDADLRNRTGALVLALRHGSGPFVTNPGRETVVCGGQVLIAMGTEDQLGALAAEVAPP
jgi:voltage-gated potassium channel